LLVAQGNLTGIVYAEIPDRQLRERLGVKHSIQAVNQGIDEKPSRKVSSSKLPRSLSAPGRKTRKKEVPHSSLIVRRNF
jgi:hypothetical protein